MVHVVKIRDNVEFIPDAAKAFQRAEARVREAFGRNIDVNRTYADWDTQMAMHLASVAYRNGTGPYPGHSWAAHPSASFHVKGEALDSDDWTNPTILEILADNGFIRNRLDVPNETHHFEYIKSRDNHYGEPITETEEDDMIINIAGKKGKRRGGLYYVSGGKATFIGGRTLAKQGRYPMFTNETEIARLQKVIKGLK